MEITDAGVAAQVMRLVDRIEELEDVQAVHHNANIPDEIMESIEE